MKNSGFSLLEMIVAIMVLSLSLGALYQAVAGASKIIRVDEKYAYASGIAQSLLAEYAVVPDTGLVQSGETDGGFRWQVNAEPIEGDYPAQLDEGSLQQLGISVSWGDEDSERRINLISIVAGIAE